LKAKIRTIQINEVTGSISIPDEDFESYDVTDDIVAESAAWTWGVAGSATFTCQAGKVGRFASDGANRTQALFTFPTPSASSPGTSWWVSTKFKGPASGGIDWFVFLDDGPRFRVRMDSDHQFYIWNDGSWSGPHSSWAAGTDYILKVVPISATTYDIHVNGTKIGDTCNNSTTAGHQVVSMAIDNYNYLAGGQYEVSVDIDDVDVSWTVDSEDIYEYVSHPVQTAHPDKFHAGAELHVHAAPTTKGGTDYQIDDDFVIRDIKWCHDGCAELELGFDDSSAKAPEEIVAEVLSRHAHDSTA
jgi:hypothetical protein